MNPGFAKIAAVAGALALGALADFILGGLFKVVWFVIYAPAYCAIAAAIAANLAGTRWSKLTSGAVVALFAGAFGARLALQGRNETRVYSMDLVTDSPLMLLHSTQWPQTLTVASPKLKAALAQRPSREGIPVSVWLVTDYGCVRTSAISAIDGTEIRLDPESSWTWRLDRDAKTSEENGPGSEDHRFPWCRIKFF